MMVGMSPQRYISVNRHSHSLWEIVLNTEGRGIMEIGGEKYPFEPGTIVCQPPNIPHTKSSADGFRDIYLQPGSFPLGETADKASIIILQDDADRSFEALFVLAHRTYHKKEPNYQGVLNALYEAIYQFLLSRYRREPQDREIERLKNRLIQSFTDPEFPVAAMMEESFYNVDHLRRRFKQATGFTPLEYLTELRIEHAKRLIRENHLPHHSMGEIAAMSGYLDSHYFSRVFRRKTGLSPTEYALEHSSS